ncbi:MAG: hypothetical protein ACI4TM_04820, partial [Candidatus Cryptobacteroides sp.]
MENSIFDVFRNVRSGHTVELGHTGREVFFRIEFDAEGRAVLRVTDAEGKDANADYRHYAGDTFLLLRTLASIRESSAATLAWTSDSGVIHIDEHPQLMYQILRCSNIADENGTPLKELDGLYQVSANIVRKDRGYTPSFTLLRLEGNGPSSMSDFRFITDNYALCGRFIVPVKPLGEEFSKLRILNQPFSIDVAEHYLSILMSHFDNIALNVEGKSCTYAENSVKASPAIVFEKVSEDKALYLRLTETIPGIPVNFVEDFSPTRIVTFLPDGSVSVRKVDYSASSNSSVSLMKRICACAPDKKAAKDVYCEDGFFIIPEETAGPFLIRSLSNLAKDYILIGSDKLSEYKIRSVKPKFTFRDSSGIDFLEGFAEMEIGEQIFSISDFLSQYRKNHYVELANGEKGIVDEGYVRRIERLFDKQKKGCKVKLS